MWIIVTKEDGSFEKFNRSRMVESLEAIGVDRKTAKKISKGIDEHPRISVHEIKNKIFEVLDGIDPKLADRYYMTKKVHVKSKHVQTDGSAFLSEFLMEFIGVGRGEKLDLFHYDRDFTLRAYPLQFDHDDHETIFMSDHDRKIMNIKNGDQVGICKHREP
ncbi:MAG: hypothetical protein U9R75_02215 [Candidatus Thermoplasmatota archaeon]|nr:hypothetical protein [Candidatus Thermoplasmatota archaeon]